VQVQLIQSTSPDTSVFTLTNAQLPTTLVRDLLERKQEVTVSGHKQLKKDGERTEKKTQARKRDAEQPVVGSVTPQRAQDTSNLTDGDVAGPNWKDRLRERG
jgi:hypothetical protein